MSTAPNLQERLDANGNEWSFELLEAFDREISRIAAEYGLDTYPNQIEVIRSDQMLDAYSSIGMPVGYQHWSYGKKYVELEQRYQRGEMGLAYEIVINSDPCIAYLMEENTLTMQALVIAHACYGHNSFFKGNYLFRTWTDASGIIDYLLFAKNYIAQCELQHGVAAVEQVLDACHALMNHGVDRYKRPYPVSADEEVKRQQEREEYIQRNLNQLWRTIPTSASNEQAVEATRFPEEPQENLLYFIEKHAPLLATWERELVRIVRKLAQYFYPQRQTQVMNEGWATFWHYTLMNRLYDDGLVGDGFMLEFLQSHSSVLAQPGFDSKVYGGLNPYTLGFAIYSDIRRISEAPTQEDREWFPDLVNTPWQSTLDTAMRNFKDESFIQQYLSPKVIRDLKLFAIVDNVEQPYYEVTAIHNRSGYERVRNMLASQYNLGDQEPNIQILHADVHGDRSLTLQHRTYGERPLHDMADQVLAHLHRLWGFPVRLESVADDGVSVTRTYPPTQAAETDA